MRKYISANVVKQDCLPNAGVLEKKKRLMVIKNLISLGQDV